VNEAASPFPRDNRLDGLSDWDFSSNEDWGFSKHENPNRGPPSSSHPTQQTYEQKTSGNGHHHYMPGPHARVEMDGDMTYEQIFPHSGEIKENAGAGRNTGGHGT
jgi:hypothetical protein